MRRSSSSRSVPPPHAMPPPESAPRGLLRRLRPSGLGIAAVVATGLWFYAPAAGWKLSWPYLLASSLVGLGIGFAAIGRRDVLWGCLAVILFLAGPAARGMLIAGVILFALFIKAMGGPGA